MSTPVLLDLAGAITGFTYIALAVTTMALAYVGRTTLKRLTLALRLARIALVVAAVDTTVSLLDIPNDGLLWAVVDAATVLIWATVVPRIRRRRDLEGDRVVAEAERTVRDFHQPFNQGS